MIMMMICKGDLLLDLGQHGPGDKMKLTRWATHKHKIQQIQIQIQHGPSDKMKLTRWATHKYQAGKYHFHNVIRNVWRNRKNLSFGVYFFLLLMGSAAPGSPLYISKFCYFDSDIARAVFQPKIFTILRVYVSLTC